MIATLTVYCDCEGRRVDAGRCDGCDHDYDYDGEYEDPPLYRGGELSAMDPEKLIAERDRQNRIHDKAVDRCEEINSPTIETAAARSRMVAAELERRGLNPWADKPEQRRE
jgi:hypothetical protein